MFSPWWRISEAFSGQSNQEGELNKSTRWLSVFLSFSRFWWSQFPFTGKQNKIKQNGYDGSKYSETNNRLRGIQSVQQLEWRRAYKDGHPAELGRGRRGPAGCPGPPEAGGGRSRWGSHAKPRQQPQPALLHLPLAKVSGLHPPGKHPAREEQNTCLIISFTERLLWESVISVKARVCYKSDEVNNLHPHSKMRICLLSSVLSNKQSKKKGSAIGSPEWQKPCQSQQLLSPAGHIVCQTYTSPEGARHLFWESVGERPKPGI